MQTTLEQKSLGKYFEEFGISDQDIKEKIISQITQTVYDRNQLIVEYEKESDEYKKQQILKDVQELEEQIVKSIQKIISTP